VPTAFLTARMLNKLASCYLKTGNIKEAKIIMNKIEDIDKEKFYNRV